MFLRVRRLATGGVFESSMGAAISALQGPNGSPQSFLRMLQVSGEHAVIHVLVASRLTRMFCLSWHRVALFCPTKQPRVSFGNILAGCPYPASSAASLHLLGGAELAAVGATGLGILPGYNTLSTPKI